ncbi:MAG: TolB family protein [Planctomycetota bacterium]|jgi:hypothetical protein
MKKGYLYLFIILVALLLSAGALGYILWDDKVVIEQYNFIDRPAQIRPDYSGTVIPPNIAPLNFMVQEEGVHYCVRISSRQGEPIEVFSRSQKIMIPQKSWYKLLNTNKGEELFFDVFVKRANGQWERFAAISNKIANENIDGFLVYRKMHPTHYLLNGPVGIYQRNLENAVESPVLTNNYYHRGCLNCHTFCGNRPDKMLIGIRSEKYGNSALLVNDDEVNKIGTRFTYTSWHPSGRLAAYSINRVVQFFHTSRNQIREAVDEDSFLAYYLIDAGVVKTSPKFSRKESLETHPAWSADGRYLYFCSAPISQLDKIKTSANRYSQVKYDLMRISYDIDNDKWGELETVLSAQDTAMTALLPRASFDGRWLLLCMSDFGCFPAFQQSSDLYLIDLKAAEASGKYNYRRLEINSDQSESWHCWSSNSRWIAFSSKRRDGVFTRLYLSYIDEEGKVYKPILLPQKDPAFYDSCLQAYNTPEFIIEPITVRAEELARVIRGSRKITVDMPITMATPGTATTQGYEGPWQVRE